MARDYYEILGVTAQASEVELKMVRFQGSHVAGIAAKLCGGAKG